MAQQQVLPFALKVSAFVLSRLGRPFPGLTARMFLFMYSRPPRRKLRESQLAVKQKSVATAMRFSRYPFDERPITLHTYRWGQSDKKILLLHGWGGSTFDFRQMITALVNAGYEVIGLDAPAHGASDGRQTNLVQWMHVLEQLLGSIGPVHGIVGHSLGGLSAALALVHKQVQVPRLVMVSSAVSAPVFFQETFDLFRIPGGVMPHVHRIIIKRLHNDLLQLDLFKHMERIKAGKILMVYDVNDGIVKAEQIDNFLQQNPSVQSLKINGEGHFRIMRNEQVIGRIAAFMEQG